MTVNTLGSHEPYRSSRTVAEWLWPFLPMGIAAFSLSAVFWYHKHRDTIEVRAPLQHLYAGVYRTFGLAPSVLFFLLVLIWGTIWLVTGKLERPLARLGRLTAMLLMLGIFLNIGDGGVDAADHKGALGAWFAENLVGTFSYVPSLIVVWLITFASLLLATDFFFHDAFERLRPRPVKKAPDAGVEVAVTDHLRGLSSAVALAVRPPAASFAVAAPIESSTDNVVEPQTGSDGEAFAEPERDDQPGPQPERGRRRSYFERRGQRDGAGEGEAESADEAPVPVPAGSISEDPMPEGAPPEVAAETPAAVGDLAIGSSVDGASLDGASLDGASRDGATPDGGLDSDAAEPAPAAAAEAIEPAEVYETPEAIEDAETDSLAPGYDVSADEPWVAIPRPEPAPPAAVVAEAPPAGPDSEPEAQAESRGKQQHLFGGGGVDDGLVQDAIDVVVGSRRASAAFLQRKLRIDYALAIELLAELAARGVVAIEGDATQGRVLG